MKEPKCEYTMQTVDGFKVKKISDYGITPCDIIFSHVEKPKDYLCCKSINVYEDKWRINIYSKRYVDGIEGKYISQSYFVKFKNDGTNLEIVSP